MAKPKWKVTRGRMDSRCRACGKNLSGKKFTKVVLSIEFSCSYLMMLITVLNHVSKVERVKSTPMFRG